FLKSQDPWEVLACALENLQHGLFSVAAVPIDLMKRYDDVDLWSACANLVGFAAPTVIVRSLFEVFAQAEYDDRRRYLCVAAVAAGGLWAVDPILELYRSSEQHQRDLLQDELSWLLEPGPGKLWAGPKPIEVQDASAPTSPDPEAEPDIDSYAEVVRDRASALRQSKNLDEGIALAAGE